MLRDTQEIKMWEYLHSIYFTVFRPSLEYAASAWDPYLIKDITAIEKIQRRAARWVTSNYDWRNGISITSTLADLKWPTLAQRRQMSRLGVFYQSIHQLIALIEPIASLVTTTHFISLHHKQILIITSIVFSQNYRTIYLQVSSNCPPWNCFLIH